MGNSSNSSSSSRKPSFGSCSLLVEAAVDIRISLGAGTPDSILICCRIMSDFSDQESSRLTARTNRLPIESNTMIQANGEAKVGRLDREKTTPMYLRMYCRMGGHHT